MPWDESQEKTVANQPITEWEFPAELSAMESQSTTPEGLDCSDKTFSRVKVIILGSQWQGSVAGQEESRRQRPSVGSALSKSRS